MAAEAFIRTKLGCASALALERSGASCAAYVEATGGDGVAKRTEDAEGAVIALVLERVCGTGTMVLEFGSGGEAAGIFAL